MLNVSVVKHIAELARLKLSEDELLAFTQELEVILKYVDKLNEVDVANVEPLFSLAKQEMPIRNDEEKAFQNANKIVDNAPQRLERFIKVPKII